MRKKRRRLLKQAFKNSGADKIFASFLLFYLLAALVIWIFEPTIHTYFDSLWYCFVAVATIGFGDITATILITRLITAVLWLYAVAVIAIFTAVITNFFMELSKLTAGESVKEFLEELEHLPELSREELEQLSEKVKKFNQK